MLEQSINQEGGGKGGGLLTGVVSLIGSVANAGSLPPLSLATDSSLQSFAPTIEKVVAFLIRVFSQNKELDASLRATLLDSAISLGIALGDVKILLQLSKFLVKTEGSLSPLSIPSELGELAYKMCNAKQNESKNSEGLIRFVTNNSFNRVTARSQSAITLESGTISVLSNGIYRAVANPWPLFGFPPQCTKGMMANLYYEFEIDSFAEQRGDFCFGVGFRSCGSEVPVDLYLGQEIEGYEFYPVLWSPFKSLFFMNETTPLSLDSPIQVFSLFFYYFLFHFRLDFLPFDFCSWLFLIFFFFSSLAR